MDFNMAMASIPSWISSYSTALTGCGHRIVATIKVEDSKWNYENFVSDIGAMLSTIQCNVLEYVFYFGHSNCVSLTFPNLFRNSEALTLWNKRRATP